jgi:hypothetical protein
MDSWVNVIGKVRRCIVDIRVLLRIIFMLSYIQCYAMFREFSVPVCSDYLQYLQYYCRTCVHTETVTIVCRLLGHVVDSSLSEI